ncbi:hypothetical protein [Frankia tisae]|uniref:hypothetical protein n=1 Tax=Frankia tisae TaxID=2950104 RepID=UPI0021C00173|nr:hypothetical protein [Frankia tisae]
MTGKDSRRTGLATGEAPPDPTWPVQLPAMPGVSVHYSKVSGRHTAVIDRGISAAQMTTALARYLPADVCLVDSVSHAAGIVLTYQGEPDPRESDAPGDGEAT